MTAEQELFNAAVLHNQAYRQMRRIHNIAAARLEFVASDEDYARRLPSLNGGVFRGYADKGWKMYRRLEKAEAKCSKRWMRRGDRLQRLLNRAGEPFQHCMG